MKSSIDNHEEIAQAVEASVDHALLERFRREVKVKLPHVDGGQRVANATPLNDITGALVDCARTELGVELADKEMRVLGKFESAIMTGSVKVRPAAHIIENAIASGALRSGQTVFESTSGNFGIALGLLRMLGLKVIVLVSRKLQDGVLDAMRDAGINQVDLDVDICPAPGLAVRPEVTMAKAVASNLRNALEGFGLDVTVLDGRSDLVEDLLARQDVIGLAKLLAASYAGYCPEQYDNIQNVMAHETVTGPEIDQQLMDSGHSLSSFLIVSTFGTGGTSTGLSRYAEKKHGIKPVHVVFPLPGQDVAGIRTKDKANGLRFYEPRLYAGEHELDFSQAKKVLWYFNRRGYDIGESGALALLAVVRLASLGVGRNFVVILADGIAKYRKNLETPLGGQDVGLESVKADPEAYSNILWTHTSIVPREEGISLIAKSLGRGETEVKIINPVDVSRLIASQQVSPDFESTLRQGKGKVLLICVAGSTSLTVAKLLKARGIEAESLKGGILAMSAGTGRKPFELVQAAT